MRTLLALTLFAACLGADTLALKDGRFVDEKPIEKTEKGYVVKFEHGDVTVPPGLVLAFHKEGAETTFTPTTELEKRKFEKGWVPYKSRWVRISAFKRYAKKELEGRKLRMQQMKERRYWRNHATVKTKRFVFMHTLPDDVFEEFKDLFETYYKFFTKYWNIRPSSKFGKVTINIYHNREYFEQVSGAPSGVVGWYMPSDKDLHFYYDRQNKRYTIDVMFHEGNHMLTHMIDERMFYPWWIGEGFAEYFGASHWDAEKKTMSVGHLQSGRLAVLHAQIKDEKWVKLKFLIEEGRRLGAIGYAWTWSFCHFLLSTPKYAKGFKKYYIGLARDSSISKIPAFSTFRTVSPEEQIAALKRYLKFKSLEELEKEWYDYIKKELALERAEIDWGQAGYIMSLYGEHAKARKFFKKAIDKGSKDAYVHFGYASLKMRQNMPGIALKYAKKATQYDPLHAQAWCLQGLAMRKKPDEHDPKEAMRLLELAHEMDPDDSGIWLELEQAKQADRKKKEKEAAN